MNIRNIAIIAHVDHGKTTLVDKMIYACKAIDDRKETKELILDNNDLEKERGITILSKNVSVSYKEHKINIIDNIELSTSSIEYIKKSDKELLSERDIIKDLL